jgi:ABC-2 type transport system ATP-binding protein
MNPTVRIRNLNKIYEVPEKTNGIRKKLIGIVRPKVRQIPALVNVNFDCFESEIVGYLGPNGAGKSTTIKCLTGIIHPSSGTCEVLGMTPGRKRSVFNRRIGVMFGQRSMLFWDIPVGDTMWLYKIIYDLSDEEYKRNLTELTEGLGVQHLLDRPARKLSFGQRVRCDLVAALLHYPQVVFLDEPTVGMDLEGKRMLRAFLTRYKEERKATIILTTHQLDDIEAVCDRIVLINKGQVLFDGSIAELWQKYANTRTIRAEVVSLRDEQAFAQLLAMYAGSNKDKIELTVPKEATTEAVTSLLHAAEIHDIMIGAPSLETVIAQWY